MLGLLTRIRKSGWAGYLISPPACLLAWAGHIGLYHLGAVNAPYLPFFIAMLVTGILGGTGPGLFTLLITKLMTLGFLAPFYGEAPLPSSNLFAASLVICVAIGVLLFTDFSIGAVIKLDDATRALRAVNETLEARIQERSAALLVAEESLRQSQKMEAVGQLTGGIAHDFNNLLTGIMGSLERLQSRLPDAPRAELTRYIAAAQDDATRAANLTNRLLAFARRQPLTPRGTDIDRLIAGMAELIHRTIGPAIQLEIPVQPGRHAVLVDPNQLEHALLNLCINASDAMPSGGILRLATANLSLAPPASAALDLPPGDYVILSVTDTGTGMAPDILARAFDPFFTTKPIGQGTGLGLSMIYGFARQSGGHAEILSAPGHGTTVTLYLPRHPGPTDAPAPPPCPAAAAAGGHGETILLVDDEASIRRLAAEVLAEQGYTIHQAENAEDALAILQSAPPIDLLITDLGLPGLSGRELAEAALALRPALKILFITGYGDRPGHPASAGTSTLAKPFAMTTLAARAQDMLNT